MNKIKEKLCDVCCLFKNSFCLQANLIPRLNRLSKEKMRIVNEMG